MFSVFKKILLEFSSPPRRRHGRSRLWCWCVQRIAYAAPGPRLLVISTQI